MIAIDITFILVLSKETGLGFLQGIRKYKVRGLMGLGRAGQGLGFPGSCVCRPHLLGTRGVPSLCQPVWETEGNMNTFQEKY